MVNNYIQSAIRTIGAFDRSGDSSDPTRPPSTEQSLIQSLLQFGEGSIEARKFNEEFKHKFSQLEVGERITMIGQLAQLFLGTEDPQSKEVHLTFQNLLAGVQRELEGITAMLTSPVPEKKYDKLIDPSAIPIVQMEIKHVAELINSLEASCKYAQISDLMQKDIMDPIFGGKLYLGPSNASRKDNFAALHKQGVNHILIILDPTLAKSYRRAKEIENAGFKVTVLPLPDLSTDSVDDPVKSQQFKESLLEAFKFLDEGLREGNGTVIHCNAGVHRSPAVLMAYFMKKFGVSFNEAQTYIQHMRSRVRLGDAVTHPYREYLKSADYREFMETL